MFFEVRSPTLLSVVGMGVASLLPMPLQAADLCTGHKMLPTPRSELSCIDLKLQIYPSPDRTLRAVAYPADISLDVTPDMESRIVIRTGKGQTLTSKDYSSPAVSTGTTSSMQNGPPIRNSLFTACHLRAAISYSCLWP